MDPDILDPSVWVFGAFRRWLALTAVPRRLGLPLPGVSAAILGWVATGVSLPWMVPLVEHWLRLSSVASHWLQMLRL